MADSSGAEEIFRDENQTPGKTPSKAEVSSPTLLNIYMCSRDELLMVPNLGPRTVRKILHLKEAQRIINKEVIGVINKQIDPACIF